MLLVFSLIFVIIASNKEISVSTEVLLVSTAVKEDCTCFASVLVSSKSLSLFAIG